MELYRYKAVDADGRLQRGQADAVNPIDLEMRLTRLGLDLVSYRPLKPGGLFAVRSGIRRPDLITFCFHMEQLLEAGVPMIDALTDLRDSLENRRLQEITAAMIESIQGGKGLSEAMRDFPYVFNTVFVNLVRAGEGSGTLTRVLRQMIDNLKWQDEQAAHTKRLFIYPIVVGVVVGGAMVSLMVFVVPELLKFVQSTGQELPLHTRILIAVSGAFASYWPFFLAALVSAILATLAGIKYSPGFRLWYDALCLGIPLFGVILKKLILTRISTYFALMYSSGITVLECMKIAEDIAGNRAVEEALRGAARQIGEGSGIAASFASTGLFPPLVLRMLRVGENTGALEAALNNVSYFYTRDVRESIERLQALIEPAMILILAALILWVALSVLGPIYDVITTFKY
ncbi:MAG: type II secretion system F family protein [Gammaproteobacteria bacterium]